MGWKGLISQSLVGNRRVLMSSYQSLPQVYKSSAPHLERLGEVGALLPFFCGFAQGAELPKFCGFAWELQTQVAETQFWRGPDKNCQGRSRGFESRVPLYFQSLGNSISRFYPIITQLTGFQFTNADSSWVTASIRLSSDVLV